MCSTRNIGLLLKSFQNLAPRGPLHGLFNKRSYAATAIVSRIYTSDDVYHFKSTFPEICQDLTNLVRKYDDNFVPEWFHKTLSYNANGGKMNRGQLTVIAYKMLADERQFTPENMKLARYVGWMTEVCEAVLLMMDDVIDGSVWRRNKPCWHTLPEIQMNYICDLAMLENATFLGLKKYIGHKNYYPRVFRLFTEGLFRSGLANTTDLILSKEPIQNLTMEKLENMVKDSTCFTGLCLPVNLAMEMCGFKDPAMYDEMNKVLASIGFYFKSQNDYQDCFDNFEVTGKESNDISQNKPTWLAVKALQCCDSHQREIMETCYGQKDPQKVARIMELYKDLGIDKLYLKNQEESYERIYKMIEDIRYDTFKPLLKTVWSRIYNYK